jgi:Mg2+ and Co2+ transporter CorA
MFVLSWYGSDLLSNELKVCHNYKKSDKWYEYLFIDGNGVNVKNSGMKEQLLKKATYDRWSEYGTLWGVSRYSMVALTNSNGSWLVSHLNTMYFQMITILLATRASILRFSDEVAALASDDTFEIDRLTKLYKRYLIFYNRLYFKEVTHQDQGIELYDMARKQMKIDEHMEKLDNKFIKLFSFAELQSSNESQDKMDKLTIMGAIFLPPSLLVALFSMGIYDYDKSFVSLFIGLGATFASAVLGYVAIRKIIKKRK